MAKQLSTITIELNVSYRHRWLGLSFAWASAAFARLLGISVSDKAAERLARIAYALMGARVETSLAHGPAN